MSHQNQSTTHHIFCGQGRGCNFPNHVNGSLDFIFSDMHPFLLMLFVLQNLESIDHWGKMNTYIRKNKAQVESMTNKRLSAHQGIVYRFAPTKLSPIPPAFDDNKNTLSPPNPELKQSTRRCLSATNVDPSNRNHAQSFSSHILWESMSPKADVRYPYSQFL